MAETKKSGEQYKVYALTMLRNDADVIAPFLAQASELFDKILIADVQSTDGTREAIDAYAATGKAKVYTVEKQEKYQSALMNRLARVAFQEGADWIFLIDGDEFIKVESREELQRVLKEFAGEVMHLPWINMVPSQYGSFTDFDVSQPLHWSGRTSPYKKVALSSLFIANNPEFYIHEGNHSVSRDFTSPPLDQAGRDGLAMLHLPIRSSDRFKYKISSARKALQTKHNRLEGEGTHVDTIGDLIQSTATFGDRELNAIAANYGDENAPTDIDPARDNWPTIKLPRFVLNGAKATPLTLNDTLQRDQAVKWDNANFARGSTIGAVVQGDRLVIRAQPMLGSGKLYQGVFAKLPPRPIEGAPSISPTVIAGALEASFMKIKIMTFSAWSELIVALFCMISIARPRRFVELGTHYGMAYFAACQASDTLDTGTTCVAVDNWIGDAHASFHSSEVFDRFSSTAKEHSPNHIYIRANFEQALECFEDGSVDLLHIDGYHTYEAVKNDFETWLPKMSASGVILFHDINVHERGFGVWRLWEELEQRYPSFCVLHCHGLGMIYVGSEPSVISEIMNVLRDNPEYKQIVQSYLELAGRLGVEYRAKVEELNSVGASGLESRVHHLSAHSAAQENEIRRLNEEYNRRDSEIRALIAERDRVADERDRVAHERDRVANERDSEQHRFMQEIHALRDQSNSILRSTSWRLTAPVRKVMLALRSSPPQDGPRGPNGALS
jgi:glycosyltransferase involved in cell wall biosynthesis